MKPSRFLRIASVIPFLRHLRIDAEEILPNVGDVSRFDDLYVELMTHSP